MSDNNLQIISFLTLRRIIGAIGIFTVLDDEFGYWGIAAYLAGFDWSDAVSKIPYYSYGYSMLLVPLFWIFDNPMHIYKAAIFLNGIMLSACFLLCYDIAKKLSRETNSYILMGFALLISMYPTYVAYSNIAWSECLLIFTCWLLTWCFVGLDEKASSYKFVLIGFLSIYLYVIHQRALGILIASISVILMMKLLNKIKLKQFIMVVIPIIFLLIVHFYLKDYIQSNVWLNASGNLTNDYSDQASKISQMFTINGLIKAFKIFLGQFFYLGAASYLVFYFGLYELVQKVGKSLITAIQTRKLEILNYENNFYLNIFLLIAILSSIAISVIFMINPNRIDQIVYGRYTDMLVGPIILLGLLKFKAKNLISTKVLLSILASFSLLTLAVYLIIQTFGLTELVLQNAIGLLFMATTLNVYLPALIAILVCFLIFRSFNQSNKQIAITIIVITGLFFVTGNKCAEVISNSNQNVLKLTKVVNFIQTTDDNLPVYFLWDDQNNPTYDKWDNRNTHDRLIADYYQFLLTDEPIKLVNKEELAEIEEKKFVLSAENKYLNSLLENYTLCISNEYSYLLVSKTNK